MSEHDTGCRCHPCITHAAMVMKAPDPSKLPPGAYTSAQEMIDDINREVRQSRELFELPERPDQPQVWLLKRGRKETYLNNVRYLVSSLGIWLKTRETQVHGRQERCTRCGEMVTDWVDPDWSSGRICLQCEEKYEPKD